MSTKNISTEPLIVERTFDTPIAKVWTALTNVDEMRRWYFDLKNFKPEVGCEFQFIVEHEGNVHDHRCKITEVVPQKKSPTPGDMKDTKETRSSRLNCLTKATKQN
jgi:uncharacterized protein YndB with AHSA1/START domain